MNNLYTTRTWAEIDLDAIAYNLKEIRRVTEKDAKIMCVVKADAYGHGFFEIAKTLQENGADAFAVATFEEAKLLRNRGFTQLILVLGRVDESLATQMVTYDISSTVFDTAYAETWYDEDLHSNKYQTDHEKQDLPI